FKSFNCSKCLLLTPVFVCAPHAFSYTYRTPPSQILPFDTHTNALGVACHSSFPAALFHSFAKSEPLSPIFPSFSSLFAKNGGCTRLFPIWNRWAASLLFFPMSDSQHKLLRSVSNEAV